MAKQNPKRKDERSKKEKDAYFSSLEAGTKYVLVQNLGDTSKLGSQAEIFREYAESQGLDTEKDLNGLPRHVELYSKIVPDAQTREKESLIETISQNFDDLVEQLPSDILLQTAVHLGRTEGEKGLEKTLSESPENTAKIKKAFGDLYEPSALIQSYIAINNNPTEIAQSATWALQRSYKRRAAKFQYINQGRITINRRKLLPQVKEQIGKVEQEDANEAMVLIGSSLALKKIQKEIEKQQSQNNPQETPSEQSE